jgi:nucleotide-binding universal stress UspA family protein
MKITKVLVALDGSRESEVALQKTVDLLTGQHDAKVILVRAVDPASLARQRSPEARMVAINEAAEYLGDVAARLRTEGVRPVVRSVWYAPAGPAIAAVARTVRPDLILMVAHRRNDAGRLVPGPVAQFVRDRTQMPILLVAAAGSPDRIRARGATVPETELVHA